LAALLRQTGPASRIHRAIVPVSVVGGTRDGAAALVLVPVLAPVLVSVDDEIGAAAAVYPNTAAIKSPTVALIAGGVAALFRQLHSTPRIGRTIVPPAIVGRTREALGRASLREKQRSRNNHTQ
jgi:hypothetical protein